jgi:hypothetical protein
MGLLSIYGSGMHMYNRVRSAIYGVIARHICVGNGCMGIWAHGYMRTWDICVGNGCMGIWAHGYMRTWDICVGNGCMGIWAHGYMRTWDISVGAVARHICVSKET